MNRKLLPALILLVAVSAAAQTKPEAPAAGPAKAGQEKVEAGKPSSANSWFQVGDQDLGTYFHHEEAVGHFPFQNPNNEAVQWKSLMASCQCSRAIILLGKRRYEYSNKPTPNMLVRVTDEGGTKKEERVSQIEIAPHEAGEVEVHMDMSGYTGMKSASLDIHMTDPAMPMTKLNWRATGAQMFQISPAEVNLNQMTWNDQREFTVTVTSPIAKDFNLTHMDDAGKDFSVKYDKAVKDGLATWTIHGTYGPVSSETGGGGVLKFYTDIKGEPTFLVRVAALVTGPMDVKPGSFVGLGMVKKGTSKSEKITITPNDGIDLQATELKFEGLSVDAKFVSARQSKNGKDLVIEVEIGKDAPAGLLKGTLVIALNHPTVKERKIMFNGYVR